MRESLIELPEKIELVLFLIQAELKTRKFFNGLQNVGLDDCDYQCNFNALIADCIGFDDRRDEDFQRFDAILEKYSDKIKPDKDSIMKQVMDAYIELVIETKKQQNHYV